MAKGIIQQNARSGFASITFFTPNSLELVESFSDIGTRPTEQSINLASIMLESIALGESFAINPRQWLECAGLYDEQLKRFVDEAKVLLRDIRHFKQAH